LKFNRVFERMQKRHEKPGDIINLKAFHSHVPRTKKVRAQKKSKLMHEIGGLLERGPSVPLSELESHLLSLIELDSRLFHTRTTKFEVRKRKQYVSIQTQTDLTELRDSKVVEAVAELEVIDSERSSIQPRERESPKTCDAGIITQANWFNQICSLPGHNIIHEIEKATEEMLSEMSSTIGKSKQFVTMPTITLGYQLASAMQSYQGEDSDEDSEEKK